MVRHETEGLQIFGGYASEALTNKVAEELGVVACMPGDEFVNNEVSCTLPDSIRGNDVFVIQSHCNHLLPATDSGSHGRLRSPQDALMEQLVIVNAARSSWAGRVIAVAPFVGFGRQDRRTGRQSITASLSMEMLKVAGADGMMSVDMHSPQAEGFFDGPFEHLTATPCLADYICQDAPEGELVIVSPDNGRLKAAGRFRDRVGDRAGIAVIDKKRNKDGTADTAHMVGDSVEGLPCFIVDDMIDGAGTIVAAANTLHNEGASHITAMATHGLFSGPAVERLADSPIDKLVVTDTVPIPRAILELARPRLEIVSIASFLARAIQYVHEGRSVESLHEGMPQRI